MSGRLRLLALALPLAACARAPGSVAAPDGGPALQFARAPVLAVDDAGVWQRSALAAHTSRLTVGDDRELPLARVDLHVRVDGFRARVLADLWFDNPDDRIWEGTFQLRLPDAASPYYLAFGQQTARLAPPPATGGLGPRDVLAARASAWIAVKEARMVARADASAAYRETVRPRLVRVVVDPALAEWAGAGVFNARLFPIAARTRHRVVVGYDLDLVPDAQGLALTLPLPEVPELHVDLDLAAADRLVVEPAAPAQPAGERLHVRLDDPRGAVTLRRPGRAPVLLQGDDPGVGPVFAAELVPELPAAPAAPAAAHAVFVVDASLSSNPARFATWLALLREVLDRNRPDLRSFAVVCFNVEARWWQPRFVANTPEHVEAALAHAAGVALEGATDLGAALEVAARPGGSTPDGAPFDLFLLSDGAATWGEDDPHALVRRLRARAAACGRACPAALRTYRTHGAGVDPRFLAELSRGTGGSLVGFAGDHELARAATAHRAGAWDLVAVELPGGEDLLLAGRPPALHPGQPLRIAGRGALPADAAVTLRLRRGGSERAVVTRLGPALRSDLAPRIYGEIAVDQLEDAIAGARVEAEAYARHFRVTGRAASLLMLERDDDYRRRGLPGPGDDAPQVARRPVGSTLAAAAPLVDPRRASDQGRLLGALADRGAAVDVRVPPLLLAAPAADFDLAPAPLATRASTWDAIPAALRPRLAAHRLDPRALAVHADERRARHSAADGLKALSSLAELQPGDDAVLHELAMTALAWDEPAAAAALLRRATGLPRPDPVAHHLLAVALAAADRPAPAVAHFELALAAATADGARDAVVLDYRALLTRVADAPAPSQLREFARTRRGELDTHSTLVDMPAVVTLHWSAPEVDVDLHVTEPSGAEIHYGRRGEQDAGQLVLDATDGHGPEVYALRSPVPGTYRVGARFFSGDRHRAATRTRALVTVHRAPGLASASVTRHLVTLEPGQGVVPVTTVELP
jgi:hypothetical protein